MFYEIHKRILHIIAHWYRRINSTKSPASGIGTFEIMDKYPKPGDAGSRDRVDLCFCSQSGGSVSIGLLT